MLTYSLFLVYLDGEEKKVVLSKPHTLATTPTAALVYEDAEGNVHNIPLSSLKDFYFNPRNYNLCEADIPTTNLLLPTPGCDCSDCQRKVEKIKLVAGKL